MQQLGEKAFLIEAPKTPCNGQESAGMLEVFSLHFLELRRSSSRSTFRNEPNGNSLW